MQLRDIIQTWYTLASGGKVEQSDMFFRFVAVWVAFNALYTSMHSDETGDWDQVRSFAGEPRAIDWHRRLLEENESYYDAVEVLKERPIRSLGRSTMRTIRSMQNLTEVLSCVYQVRCNLFHGGKAPGNIRDEKLVNAGYVIIANLIEPFLDKRLDL